MDHVRVRGFGTLNPKWNVFITPVPSKLRGPCRRGDRKTFKSQDVSKETSSSRHNRADKHIGSETVTTRTQPGQIPTRQNPNPEKERQTLVPALAMKLYAIDGCRERESPLYSTTRHGRPHEKVEHKTVSMSLHFF